MKTPRASSAALSIFRYNLRKRVTKSDATGVEHWYPELCVGAVAEIHPHVETACDTAA